jgi:hypothetical protein
MYNVWCSVWCNVPIGMYNRTLDRTRVVGEYPTIAPAHTLAKGTPVADLSHRQPLALRAPQVREVILLHHRRSLGELRSSGSIVHSGRHRRDSTRLVHLKYEMSSEGSIVRGVL